MASKGKHVVSNSEIAQFNMVRLNLAQKQMSRTELKEQMKQKMGYHMHDMMIKAMCTGPNPPIIRVARGLYVVNPEPVHIKRLQTAWDTYTKCANPRHYKSGQYELKPTIEQAIKVLKEAGYKVLKPVTQYEEC